MRTESGQGLQLGAVQTLHITRTDQPIRDILRVPSRFDAQTLLIYFDD